MDSLMPKLPARWGRADRLCSGSLDVNLLCYRKGIVDLNAEVFDGAFDLCVAEQKLHGP